MTVNDVDDDELFLWYGWPTKGLALFPAGTIARDLHHRESPTRREQDLNPRRTRLWWMKLCSSDNHYTTAAQCGIFVMTIIQPSTWDQIYWWKQQAIIILKSYSETVFKNNKKNLFWRLFVGLLLRLHFNIKVITRIEKKFRWAN